MQREAGRSRPSRRHPVAAEAQPRDDGGAARRPAPTCCARAALPNCRSKRCAGKVGATVGAFYSRFESKEAYFNALMALAARDGERRLSAMTGEHAVDGRRSLAELCRLLVGGIIGWIRNHEGVLRAALQHDDTRPDRWNTFKGLARANTAGATPLLLRAMGKGRTAAKTPRHRLRFSGRAGHAGQRHPQRSRTAVDSRQGDGGAVERLPVAAARSRDEAVHGRQAQEIARSVRQAVPR